MEYSPVPSSSSKSAHDDKWRQVFQFQCLVLNLRLSLVFHFESEVFCVDLRRLYQDPDGEVRTSAIGVRAAISPDQISLLRTTLIDVGKMKKTCAMVSSLLISRHGNIIQLEQRPTREKRIRLDAPSCKFLKDALAELITAFPTIEVPGDNAGEAIDLFSDEE